jgi:hypothetical protein
MIDYLLVFPSKQVAEQFGIANGFASKVDGEVVSSLASHEHAIAIIGEHEGDGQYWVLFRDLVGIPIPEGAEQFINWSSDSGELLPSTSPQQTWA